MALGNETLPQLLLDRVRSTPDGEAFLQPIARGWRTLRWREVGEQVAQVALGLRGLGLQPEERCAIICSTRVEWILADFGILCAGGATTTVYPSNTAEDCAYILRDSQSAFVFAENDEQVKKLVAQRASLAAVRHVILFDGAPSEDGWVMTFSQLLEAGKRAVQQNPKAFEEACREPRPDQLATLIYTSGTTGAPKGVELTHDCWAYEAEAIDRLRLLRASDRQYLWLPLSHSFGKVLLGAQIRIGFPTAVDGRVEKMVENLAVVRPTFVAAVPRIFEKVHNKVIAGAKAGGPVKELLFKWALGVGRKVSTARQRGDSPPLALLAEHAIADKLVLSKIRDRFGGRLRFFISGSAPLPKSIAEFFHAAGLLILEGYGLTETSAASFVNVPHRFRFGTVGPPLPGTEVKIAEDGEVLIKSRGVMRGYHGMEEATRETFAADGYFRTGDIGELDAGLLRITDRKKDLIKTSSGKYVAPQAVEGKLKTQSPFISQALVHGNNRNFCVALISLDEETLRKWAEENGAGKQSYEALSRDGRVRQLVSDAVAEVNRGLPNHEAIKNFALLPKDLTLEEGDLTPSLKLKRKAVEAKYRDLLDGFYRDTVSAL